MSSILYLRNCFEEDAFQPLQFQGLHLRQLKPVNPKAKRILGWLQEAVKEALQKEYLEHLSLGIHCRQTDKLLECYQFHFTYTATEAGVSVSVRKGSAGAFEPVGSRLACVTKDEAKRQTELLLRSMCCLIQSLDHLPDEHYVSMTTPPDYRSDGFAPTDSPVSFGNDVPLDALTGELRTGYHELTVRIQTVCDSEDTYYLEWEGAAPEEELPTRFRHVTKEIIASACAVSQNVAKELLKHLIQQGLVKAKQSRGQGHEGSSDRGPRSGGGVLPHKPSSQYRRYIRVVSARASICAAPVCSLELVIIIGSPQLTYLEDGTVDEHCCHIAFQLPHGRSFPRSRGRSAGKVHGSLARAGKVKNQTPKVAKKEKRKPPTGRAKKRQQFNRRFTVSVGRKRGPNAQTQ
ncbi:HORMA domain-containing protein [Besnoitia besnoiti]|uniref:HORMA domain-containing protein n=1 Tax=Besnoitia besnoiti TaxID=94643 RepID=A0A2A9M6N9_BESBE|nr:HORMA domain-containing protein [Besnoitia besnoiti]PFH31971.1 HORMA domain-containing protein [Besnoitia besnoiti]